MATAAARVNQELIADQIRTQLATVPAADSAYLMCAGTTVSVWIGIRDDESASYRSVYAVTDRIAEQFPKLLFDFHVVPIPNGRAMEDFISDARPIFRRTAA
ncbi:MAG: hypothetical protein ACE14L_03675 [Terriglobales bacterium]